MTDKREFSYQPLNKNSCPKSISGFESFLNMITIPSSPVTKRTGLEFKRASYSLLNSQKIINFVD